jgi:hypothetical protein
VPSTAPRRVLAGTVLHVARPFAMVLFRWGDTHGHTLVVGPRAGAAEFGRRLEIALTRALRPSSRFEAARLKPIRDVWYLASTFRYVLGQDEHHGFQHNPVFDASNAPGSLDCLRSVAGRQRTCANTCRAFAARTAWKRWAGRDPDREVHREGDLVDAAAAAAGVVGLGGKAPGVIAAKRALIALAEGRFPDQASAT